MHAQHAKPLVSPWPQMEETFHDANTQEVPTSPASGSFPNWLRSAGALTVIAAMSAFLMQEWAGSDSISRYYMLLVQTLLLALCGFGLSYVVRENKGARVFFGLSLISITANMTTLGALIFSTTQWGGDLSTHYPAIASWKASAAELTFAMASGLVLLVPVALFGFMVLARRSAVLLTVLCLGANLLLILPVRDGVMVGALTLLAGLVPLMLLQRRRKNDATLVATLEGRVAVACVLLPAAIMLCRSLWLYPADAVLNLMLASGAFLAMRIITTAMEDNYAMKGLALYASIFCAALVGITGVEVLEPALGLSLFSGVFALLLMDVGNRAGQSKPFVIGLASLMLALCHLVQLNDHGSVLHALACIVAGAAVVGLSLAHKHRKLMLLGAITAGAGVVQQLQQILVEIDFAHWITLAVLGSIAIILGSLLERHGAHIKNQWNKLGE